MKCKDIVTYSFKHLLNSVLLLGYASKRQHNIPAQKLQSLKILNRTHISDCVLTLEYSIPVFYILWLETTSPLNLCGCLPVGTPLSLQQLSRVTLRTMLGSRALEVVVQLDIPKQIISFLCYH